MEIVYLELFHTTGSEAQHFSVQQKLIAHMISVPHLLVGRGIDGHRN